MSNFSTVEINKDRIVFTSQPSNIVSLQAEETFAMIPDYITQNGYDEMIKKSLALKLAEKMIEEDLIEIKTGEDILKREITVRAKVKIIQE